ncbi:hypothetical protein VNI00_015710 [Paramarasmius palmivorus]|uniref:Uncharacterized protein n=1 Tax=Paramarasmius palmivorus TaxID=297713 RepID=A0AAW0BH86_9AGAR
MPRESRKHVQMITVLTLGGLNFRGLGTYIGQHQPEARHDTPLNAEHAPPPSKPQKAFSIQYLTCWHLDFGSALAPEMIGPMMPVPSWCLGKETNTSKNGLVMMFLRSGKKWVFGRLRVPVLRTSQPNENDQAWA